MRSVFSLTTKTTFLIFLVHRIRTSAADRGHVIATQFPVHNNVKGWKYRRGENTLTDGKESPPLPAACPLADAEAVSSRELIVAADSGQTSGRCSWQADSSCSLLRPFCLLSRCNEIICYTGSSLEPYALLPTGQRSTSVVGTSMFWNPDQLGKKVCKCNCLNNGYFEFQAMLAARLPQCWSVGWLVRLIGGLWIKTTRWSAMIFSYQTSWVLLPRGLRQLTLVVPSKLHQKGDVCV